MTYRSLADLGGVDGFGRVVPEPEGPVFHAEWERQVLRLGLGVLSTGSWTGDAMRSAIETLPDYLALSYWERWFKALEQLLVAHGLVGADELLIGRTLRAGRKVKVLRPADAAKVLTSDVPTERPPSHQARFAIGDAVRTRANAVNHHTRLPGYARGKRGRIESVHGAQVFPDTNARGLGEQPQWLYTVVFSGQELWAGADEGLTVSIDAWEPYLEPPS